MKAAWISCDRSLKEPNFQKLPGLQSVKMWPFTDLQFSLPRLELPLKKKKNLATKAPQFGSKKLAAFMG